MRRVFSLSFILTAAFLLAQPGDAQAQAVTTLARLGGNPDGYHPRATLIDGGDGFFYGTSEAGGPPNCGTVYKVDSTGTLTTLYAFAGGGDGANPIGGLVLGSGGYFYGTTSGAGSGGTGTVFKISAAGALTTLHSFGAITGTALLTNTDGAHPYGSLIQGTDGNLYGTANFGGANGAGTVFQVTPSGDFAKLAEFPDGLDGLPGSGLAQGSDGNFYGVLANAGANYSGSIYRVASAGGLTTLHDFAGGDEGYSPEAALVKGTNGNLYGTTAGGGTGNAGTIFEITLGGKLTTLHAFDRNAEGQPLDAPLTPGTDGNLYGATSRSGPDGFGTAYRVTQSGAVTVLAPFPGNGNQGGSSANGALLGGDGSVYGTTRFTGNADAGFIFKITSAGTLTALHPFQAGGKVSVAALAAFPNGAFYGVTQQGGATGDGTVFGLFPDGTIATVHDFIAATEGKAPATRLVPDANGNYYGTCDQEGPNGGGSIYVVNPLSGSTNFTPRLGRPVSRGADPVDLLKIRISFLFDDNYPAKAFGDPEIVDLHNPFADLTFFRPFGLGYMDGYHPDTGDSPNETETPAASMGSITNIYTFTGGDDGAAPLGGVVTGADGNYYGTTSQAGANGQGTICSITPAGMLTTLHAFAGTGDGAQPRAGLLLASDGNFYGTTAYASFNPNTASSTGNGTIFKLGSDGSFTTLHTFASDGSEGASPDATLLEASDGKLYGVTKTGGNHGDGVVFSITTDGTFTKVGDLTNPGLFTYDGENSTYGSGPASGLIQGSDGRLYGTTTSGGTERDGVVFVVDPTAVAALPAVTLTAPIPTVAVNSGQFGEYLLTIPAPLSSDLHINFTIKGTATNGTDYRLIAATKKLKAGTTQKTIKIFPQGNLEGATVKSVNLLLAPGTGYSVGTTSKVKVKITDPQTGQ